MDFTKEVPASGFTGLVDYNLGGAAATNDRRFRDYLPTGSTFIYFARTLVASPLGVKWEKCVGTLTYGNPDVLTRATVLASSNAGAKIDWQATDTFVIYLAPLIQPVARQNIQSGAYTTVMADWGGHILHPSADTTARTWTIDSNANVPYPIGAQIEFVNQNAAGVVTIAITADTMRLAGAGTTGSRTLAANGTARARKITATEWLIDGTGLT